MRCEEARARMLAADPAELAGAGPTPLARHLAACEACAATARALLAQDAELDAALCALAGAGARSAAAVEARPAVAGPPRDSRIPDHPAPPAPRRARVPRPALAALVPLAAAAALALLLLRGPTPTGPAATAGLAIPSHAVVNAVGARGVTVMQTRNPDITVVWTF